MRRAFLVLAAIFLGWAALVVATGGVHVRVAGVLFRSRAPARALLPVVILVIAQAVIFRRESAADVDRVVRVVRRFAPWLAAAAALVLGVHGLRFGNFTAGGSDGYGYVSQAYGWTGGHLPRAYDLPLTLPFESGDAMQTPLGYRLGPRPHTMVPTYAAGLPLMMAAAILATGAIGPYLIVPLSAALYVWFTFLLGRRAAGPIAGLIAATLVATSPVVLFQSLWPMSDVPAGALWTAAVVAALGDSRPRVIASGLCTALAVLVRPNLPLLVLVPLARIVVSGRGRERFIRIVLFCAPLVPVVIAVAALNSMWFGSPFNSGYGRTTDLYSLGSVWPNLRRYPVWLWRSQSPWILVAAFSLLVLVRRGPGREAVTVAWALCLVTMLSYIGYFPFEEWWYLRFLLPGLGAFFVLVAVGLTMIARRLPLPWGPVIALVIVLLMVKHATGYALGQGVFGPLQNSERRYADVGDFVNRTLPDNAVVFAMQHSGTVRFYGGRLTLRYDFLNPARDPDAPAALERLGFHPYLVIDDWEAPDVQKRFKLSGDLSLPWPFVARMRENGGVTIYDLATTRPNITPVALSPDRAPVYSAPKPLVSTPR